MNIKRVVLRERGDKWCEVKVELKDGRLSICGSEGRILGAVSAKKEARQYWESFFEESPEELGRMAVDYGTRKPKTAAAKVQEIDGAYHGLDVHKATPTRVYVTESCGQIRETIAEWFPEVAPYLAYHLNDMHAGTEAQEAELEKHTWDGAGSHYDWACARLSEAGLLHDRSHMVRVKYKSESMGCDLYKRVPYKYGSAWLKRDLPREVIAWVKSFGQEVAA
jgi:hypothetical protein